MASTIPLIPETGHPGIPEKSPRLFRATGVRTTPQVEWVEIQVKSVLNRVKGMPFNWSINPYRGCEHACVFCMSGDTPILMADGTHKPLTEVRPGDEVYGTVVRGAYRRYARTQVLAQWTTVKPAYRITLEDGSELVASGDHRFLSDRGWKFVVGAEHGRYRRPFLTLNNKLRGVGAFAQSPQRNSDYQRGYLSGLIRGDGLLGAYKYNRPGRRHGNVYQFRLALTDVDALHRAERYLRDFDVPTHSFTFQPAGARTRAVHAIRTSSRPLVDAVSYLVEWPQFPSPDWYKGFLAGIFDAEGTYSSWILRIANTDAAILEWIRRGLDLLGFNHITEPPKDHQPSPVSDIRIRGGLREHLRFFHTVDPAISRKRNIEGQAVKSQARLQIVSIEPVGERLLVDITTGAGDFIANGVISHNCYARVTHWYLDQDGVNDWSSRIFVKVNAPEVLRRELARTEWTRELVAVGTATDPYQPAEGAYRLTRRILEALRDYRTPISLITRSPMVVRDIDVLQQLPKVEGASVCFSLITMDPVLSRELEPSVAPPLKRLEALRKLAEAGIRTTVNLAPVLPGITDNERNIAEVVQAAKQYGASQLWTNALHLGDVVRDSFFKYLKDKRPHLIPEYERMYPKRYAPHEYQERVQHVVGALKARAGFTPSRRREPRLPTRDSQEPPVAARQIALF